MLVMRQQAITSYRHAAFKFQRFNYEAVQRSVQTGKSSAKYCTGKIRSGYTHCERVVFNAEHAFFVVHLSRINPQFLLFLSTICFLNVVNLFF